LDQLHAYISEGEHQQQDFKFRVDDAKKIARTLSAFANTDGGRLLIGVKDNGKVVGINPEEEYHIIEGAAELYCKPKVPFSTQVWQEDHKLVLEVIIPPSGIRPHKAKDEDDRWKTYVRRDDHTLLANKILIGVWKLRKNPSDKPQQFTDQEHLLLNTIKTMQSITLSKLYRKTNLKMAIIDKLLVQFVAWDIIEMNITREGTFYTIYSEKEENQSTKK
jgi:predicted HTH transcriptional regulator